MQSSQLSRRQAAGQPVARTQRSAIAAVPLRSAACRQGSSAAAQWAGSLVKYQTPSWRNGWRVARPVVLARATSDTEDTGLTPGHPYPWEEDYDLLSNKVKELTDILSTDLKGCNIWLIGMMGSGKSTVGKMLANTLKYAFFDTDQVIELAHDKRPVSSIFAEEGQDYFRQCESQIIKELSPYRNLVISTGGGAVLRPENWGYMQMGIVCWLNGDVELLAARVAKDGIEKRPLLYAGAEQGGAVDAVAVARGKLAALLEDRRKYYENADVVVTLEGYGRDAEGGAPTVAIMYRLLSAVNEKVQAKKREQAERMNFRIEGADQLKTMRTIESPAAQQQEGQA